MKVVSVELDARDYNNVRMTNDERRRIGLALRSLRVGKELDQKDVAKKVKVSVGTVQAIEGNWYEVKDSNIDRVAKFLGTSLRELLDEHTTITAADPLLAGLNREDLQVARAFHDCATTVRQRVQAIVRERETQPMEPATEEMQRAALELADRIMRLSQDNQFAIKSLVIGLEAAEARTNKTVSPT